eukprot:CAMPEP_0117659140 /NCGR_PEP_ID=MMETSP0804-20121206/6266_1 /TAXON_ID=1074897 /ORGANISM="Tetraselmis astigmatica, Strain CCMP880" /LENGTH=116 /DNA_ID=CAMNT_0005465763 /DNA_START=36 /DNA_END=383 /DNA_ORIENTATION=+
MVGPPSTAVRSPPAFPTPRWRFSRLGWALLEMGGPVALDPLGYCGPLVSSAVAADHRFDEQLAADRTEEGRRRLVGSLPSAEAPSAIARDGWDSPRGAVNFKAGGSLARERDTRSH